MSRCNSCLLQQAWLLEWGDGSQVTCDCYIDEELTDWSNLNDFQKMLIFKWTPGCEVEIKPVRHFSVEKMIPECQSCKWKQAWMLENEYDLQIVCKCLEEEKVDDDGKTLIEKWFPSSIEKDEPKMRKRAHQNMKPSLRTTARVKFA